MKLLLSRNRESLGHLPRVRRAPAAVLLAVLIQWSVPIQMPLYAQDDLSFDARTRVLEHWINEQMSYNGAPGLVLGVVHGNDPSSPQLPASGFAWSGAFGSADLERSLSMSNDTRLRMGSVSKIFTSTAIVKLRDQGKLNFDDPVKKHLPWFALKLRDGSGESAASVDGERYRSELLDGSQITLRHLLTHTGGLPREAAVPYWTDHIFPDTDRLAEAVNSQSVLWPPGRDYQYSNLGMGLLGEVVATASGTSFGAYLDQEIFQPLGMHRSTAAPDAAQIADLAAGYMRRMPNGQRHLFEYYDTASLSGAANVISTLDDMAKFATLHLQSIAAGKPASANNEQARIAAVLSPESVREMQQSQWVRDSFSSGRGLGFSITSRKGQRVVSHGGWIAGHRSHLILVPELQIAVVAIVNADDVSPSFFAYQALDVLGPALAKKGTDRGATSTATRKYKNLEGTYTDPWHAYYEVLNLDDDLYFYEHSYPPSDEALSSLTKLTPTEDGHFVFGSAKDRVEFQFGSESGKKAEEKTEVQRILRRTDYLFPVGPDGSFVVSVPATSKP